jgi:hypothetical protein
MYPTEYLDVNGGVVDKTTSGAATLGEAIETARRRIRQSGIAVPPLPGAPKPPAGFRIYNSEGKTILHQEML